MAQQNNTQESLVQKFGYTEMYEWAQIPTSGNKFGRFVQFSKRYPDKIEVTHGGATYLAGVSSICSLAESDNPVNWKDAFLFNEVGDLYMREETLAVGVKQYDQDLEMSYVQTKPWKHHIKVKNPKFDEKLGYVPRSGRKEWVRVTLLGKAIVYDNGTCKPGGWCKPYYGDDMQLAGTAVPADADAVNDRGIDTFYILERVSDKTVKILIK